MRRTRPLIALDISRHDHLNVGYGLYRYGIGLVEGLATIRPHADFLLIGSAFEPIKEVRRVLEQPGSRWSYLHFPIRQRGRGAYFLDQFSILPLLAGKPIRLYHSTDFFIPLLLPVRLVITVYDLLFETFPRNKTYRMPLYLRCLRCAIRHRIDRIIAISRTTASDLIGRWRIPPGKISTVYLGTRLVTALASPSKTGIQSPGPVILSRYALSPWKNLQTLIEALAIVRNEYPTIRLVLYGRAEVGEKEEALFDQLLDYHGVRDAVFRLGLISDDELHEWYQAATVFVLPSLSEGFGLPILEAMAHGACVIAHNGSAMAEIVGPAGCLVDARHPPTLAKAIASVLRDPNLRQQLGLAAQQRSAQFSLEAMAESTFNVYRRCLGL